VLATQLTGSQAAEPQLALDPEEAATTVMRTLRLPDIAPLRRGLVPEIAIWSSSADGGRLLSGRSDAVLMKDGRVSAVFDWKSDVFPSLKDRASYVTQLSDYLASTGAERGAVVYMTLSEVVWLRGPVSRSAD
jgi:CRISPR-associated exonuclease Cas4